MLNSPLPSSFLCLSQESIPLRVPKKRISCFQNGSGLLSLLAVAFLILTGLSANLNAEEQKWRHGLSLFGALKYQPGFKHFDYVNVAAPKGGTLRMGSIGTFDSLNPFILKGRPASLSGMIYDTLLQSSGDEPSSEYGLLAESMSYPEDFSSVTYRLRKNARWHDGKPVTPDDVIFSLEVLKKGHPRYAYYYANIIKVEKTGEHEVTFRFSQKGNRELPQITGQLTILPRHYWEGTDANGKKRDFFASTLTPPLGSGPYRIGKVVAGRHITVERVKDYWGEKLPVNVGRNNFDQLRADYFRDDTVALEAFKGNQFDVRFENSAKNWATAYKTKSVTKGDIIKSQFVTKNPERMQAFVFNTRRVKFVDARVRHAFNLAFDFEWANKSLFYNQYTRVSSFFEGSELAATALPKGRELEILNELRKDIPPQVFTEIYKNPVNGDTRRLRTNLRKARKLLERAGWKIKDRVLINAKTGEQMKVEVLLVSPSFERIVLPYKKSLEKLGIQVKVRTVDVSQYQNRLDGFDFDMVVSGWGQSLSPGNEQRDYWGSKAAKRKGSRNLVGIKNPAIDKLIEKIIYAKDRTELLHLTHALDRVLLWNHFVVPQWFSKGTRLARWNRFGFPEKLPDYQIGFPDIWWFDGAKAAKVKK